ncbi:MAG: LysR family transcriptional regulator [Rhodoblastus sp.]|nr:LysR family transcriptional regulator [Rhodoblastus sp.]
MNWDDFRLVRAIAEARSLVGAADALGLNHSTVFRRLGQIEADLGRPLFERSRAGYAPTGAGEEMIALANRMSDGVVEFERRLAGQDERPRGELRVTTTDSLFGSLLAPMFAGFRAAYPEIRVDIIVSNASLNLSRRDADVAIRATSEPPDTLVGRKIGPMAWGVYAKAGSDLARCDPLGLDGLYIGFGPPIEEIEPAVWIARNVPAARIVARVNSMHIAALAAAAGLGLAVLPRVVGDSMPELTRMSAKPSTTSALWLLTHADLKGAARVRAFMDHAWSYLSKEKGRLAGE